MASRITSLPSQSRPGTSCISNMSVSVDRNSLLAVCNISAEHRQCCTCTGSNLPQSVAHLQKLLANACCMDGQAALATKLAQCLDGIGCTDLTSPLLGVQVCTEVSNSEFCLLYNSDNTIQTCGSQPCAARSATPSDWHILERTAAGS